MGYIPASIEKGLLHPAVAHHVNAKWDRWAYEVTLSGRYRVDFVAYADNVCTLIECKVDLTPNKDIGQLNFYHEIHGDPTARKVIATDSKVYKHSIIRQYTENNISILRLDVDLSLDTYWSTNQYQVEDFYPDNCHVTATVTKEVREAVRASYVRGETTMRQLAERFGVSIGVVNALLNRRKTIGIFIPPSDEVSI